MVVASLRAIHVVTYCGVCSRSGRKAPVESPPRSRCGGQPRAPAQMWISRTGLFADDFAGNKLPQSRCQKQLGFPISDRDKITRTRFGLDIVTGEAPEAWQHKLVTGRTHQVSDGAGKLI